MIQLIMEFFEGGSIGGTAFAQHHLTHPSSLSDILTTKKVLPEAQIGAVLAQALPALEYAHFLRHMLTCTGICTRKRRSTET